MQSGPVRPRQDLALVFRVTVSSALTVSVNEALTGNAVGDYVITKTVASLTPPFMVEHELLVQVVDPSALPEVLAPGAEPPAVQTNDATAIIFSARLVGPDVEPDSVEIRQVDSGGSDLGLLATLGDDGAGADGVAGDDVFTGVGFST